MGLHRMITKLFILCGYNVLMSKHPFNDNRKNVHVAISELFWESSFFYFFSNSEDNFNPTFLVCSLLVDTFLLFFYSAFYVTPGHMKYFYNEKLLLLNLEEALTKGIYKQLCEMSKMFCLSLFKEYDVWKLYKILLVLFCYFHASALCFTLIRRGIWLESLS